MLIIKIHQIPDYTCDTSSTFNNEINGQLRGSYGNGDTIFLMSIIEIGPLIITSLLSLCLSKEDNKKGNYDRGNDGSS